MSAATFFKDVSDPYTRRARLFPGITITLPVSILAVVLVTTKPAWWSGVVLVLGASGVSFLGAQLVRTAGKVKEQALWASWGGAPTTQVLRFAGASNRVAVQRRHDQLVQVFPDLSMPDESAESANPPLADQYYETAIGALIERTRDAHRFPRVFDELCQYGFRRNLWGCRKIGLWISVLGLATTVTLGALTLANVISVSLLGIGLSAVTDILLLIVLIFVVQEKWVRQAADAYAARLLGSLEILAKAKAEA
jgi:hypothetical protein